MATAAHKLGFQAFQQSRDRSNAAPLVAGKVSLEAEQKSFGGLYAKGAVRSVEGISAFNTP